MPRLNVHTNQILAHTFSHGTLDSVVSLAIHTLVCVVFADFACHFYQHNIFEFFVSSPFTFLIVALATTVSSLVDEGKV